MNPVEVFQGLEGSCKEANVLVRHPPPGGTESLPAYVIRLVQENGYKSTTEIFRLAGLASNERSVTTYNPVKIAAIANQPVPKLLRMALSSAESETPQLRLLGRIVCTNTVDLSGAKVCPECVAELGYIEAHWHVGVMVACPVHEKAAIWFCGKCKKRVGWNRPGLLTCSCGAPLHQVPKMTFMPSELWLLDCVRCKTRGEAMKASASVLMPYDLFSKMTLQETLSMIRRLGTRRLLASRSPHKPLGKDLLRAAATVLEEWPQNFSKTVQRVSPHTGVQVQGASLNTPDKVYALLDSMLDEQFGRRRGSLS